MPEGGYNFEAVTKKSLFLMFWVYSGKESVSQNIGCLFHSTTFLLLSSDFVFWDSLVFGSKYFILCVKGWLETTDSKYVLEKD